MQIRQRKFRQGDGAFSPEFYEILDDYEQRLEEAAASTRLPDNPDMEKVEAYVERVNRHVVTGEI